MADAAQSEATHLAQARHCCDVMRRNINHRCDIHANPFDCPDNLIYYGESTNTYGIIIHDGGESFLTIQFCPWCGKRLKTEEEA